MSQAHPKDRAPRFDIRLSAELVVDGKLVSGTTRNLSTGGVCVEIDRPMTEGATLQITLFVVEDDVEAEGARGLELAGVVQWTAEGDRGYAIGVRFVNLTAEQNRALGNALRALPESRA
jgi:hypothetical protein